MDTNTAKHDMFLVVEQAEQEKSGMKNIHPAKREVAP
jgi:hypothetical protein